MSKVITVLSEIQASEIHANKITEAVHVAFEIL